MDQSCERQVDELIAFAERADYELIGIFKETASGTKDNRKERQKIVELAQARKLEAILVTELSRWGRSTSDLLATLEKLAAWKISVITTNGMTLDLETPQGKMMATVLSGVAQFERDMLSERVKSGLAAATARGKKLGRQKDSDQSQTEWLRKSSNSTIKANHTDGSQKISRSAKILSWRLSNVKKPYDTILPLY